MPTPRLTELLDREGIKYVTIHHSRAYTAQEVAAAAHVSGKEMAKTVVTKIDGKPALVVLPAGEKVNFDQLRSNTGAHDVLYSSSLARSGMSPAGATTHPRRQPVISHDLENVLVLTIRSSASERSRNDGATAASPS